MADNKTLSNGTVWSYWKDADGQDWMTVNAGHIDTPTSFTNSDGSTHNMGTDKEINYSQTATDIVQVNATPQIKDNNGNFWQQLVGGRPPHRHSGG